MSTHSTQPMTKTDAAYRDLRAAIESGRLEPGQRLRISELEDLLGMSPTPIREALRLLQRDALVQHTPHYGTVVATFSDEALADSYRIRLELEPLATELATERASDEQIARIRKLHEQFRQAVESDPHGRRAPRLNADWHSAIYDASKSAVLIEFIDRLWMMRGKTMWISIHAESSLVEHEAVVVQMEARNAQAAGRMMRAHLSQVRSMFEDRLRKVASSRGAAPGAG